MKWRLKVSYADLPKPFPRAIISSSIGTEVVVEVIMGRCCRALGEECSIRNLGTKFHDARAFTDSPVSETN